MRIKIVPDVYFILLLSLSILCHFLLPISTFIFYPYSIAGVILIGIGLNLTFRTNRLLAEHKTSLQTFETPNLLITSGSFRFSRNPIYLGMIILLLGAALLLTSLSSLLSPLLFFIILNYFIIPFEEKMLTKQFGEKYTAYKSKVRRWL